MDRGGLPETVRLPDGRSEPFEPERISRSLFAAAERLGRPDAFLARELTDGVLHFLSTEDVGPATTPDRIAEVVGKVVRELGQPALAREFDERARPETVHVRAATARPRPAWPDAVDPSRPPAAIERDLGRSHLRSSTLQVVFPRDLVSAHAESLISLTGLDHPFELDGLVAALTPGRVLEAMEQARRLAGGFVAVDGPEYDLAAFPDEVAATDTFLRECRFAAEALGLTLILNLNVHTPPARTAEAGGPLFAGAGGASADRRQAIALDLAGRARDSHLRVWWHVAADGVRADPLLEPACRLALNGAPVEFVFDRPRGPVALGPGVDRGIPASLIRVRLDLARLADMAGSPPLAPELFLRKVGSLTRFAKTAAHVKQDFLRKHGRPGLREAFLLDRARLVLVPTGLGAAARATGQPPVEFARDVLRTIRTAAETDRPRLLPVRVESSLPDENGGTVWDAGVSLRHQLRAASQLHAITAAGRLDLARPPADVGEGVEVLRAAAESAVARLGFARP